jgi:cobalt-zinc-cadmium efflux system membrane fusion protein
MVRWIRTLGATIAGHLPTALTLVFLGAVGVWGARNDWQAPRAAAFFQKPGAADELSRQERPQVVEVQADPTPEFVIGLGWAAAFPHAHRRIAFPSEEAVRKAGLRWVPAEERPVTEHVLANGMIDYDPTTYAHLATRAPGTIWQVEKQIGEPVRRGEVLALVESADVGKVKSDFLTSLNQFDLRSRLLQRMQEAGASVAERILRESQASLHDARIRMFADQQALLNLGLVVRVEELLKLSDEQRVRELRLLGLPDSLRSGAAADTLTANLLPVAAPFDGQIVQRNAAIGEAVTSARPLFVVADLRQVHLEMAVEPADVGKLRVGQPVVFTPQVGDVAPATGKLAHIGPEVDEKTRKVWVHAEADNPDGRLRPHTFGTGRILVREERRAVVVPADAVQSDGAHRVIFVRASAESGADVPDLENGLRSGNCIEVSGCRR